MNKGKIIKIAAAVIVVLWVALGAFNIWQTKHLQKPFLAFPSMIDETGSTLYLGMGFSFLTRGDPIEYMQMYIFGFTITGMAK